MTWHFVVTASRPGLTSQRMESVTLGMPCWHGISAYVRHCSDYTLCILRANHYSGSSRLFEHLSVWSVSLIAHNTSDRVEGKRASDPADAQTQSRQHSLMESGQYCFILVYDSM